MDKEELNNIISGALLDFLGFLAVGDEDEEFNPKMLERDFPTIEDLIEFSEARGLSLVASRISNWNRIWSNK